MNEVLGDLKFKCCLVYLDDIIIYSDNAEDHVKHVELVLERLRDNNLKIEVRIREIKNWVFVSYNWEWYY